MSAKEKLIIIAGPTASGKSALALRLARHLGSPIVSADSMQVYRGMDIGTAKPTAREREQTPHYMLDVAEPAQPYSVAQYQAQARAYIRHANEQGKTPILVGGTGLYIHAVLYPMEFSDRAQAALPRRAQLQAAAAQDDGAQQLHALLRQINPQRADQLHPNDTRRVIRAIEEGERPAARSNLFNATPLYACAYIGLQVERAELIRRINARVDAMMAQGLLEEARALLRVCGPQSTALQAIGYKELLAHLQGEATLPEAVERIRIATRQYAKRQMTWFRREQRIHWLDATGLHTDALLKQALHYLQDTLHIL